jgi:hypothetical protein
VKRVARTAAKKFDRERAITSALDQPAPVDGGSLSLGLPSVSGAIRPLEVEVEAEPVCEAVLMTTPVDVTPVPESPDASAAHLCSCPETSGTTPPGTKAKAVRKLQAVVDHEAEELEITLSTYLWQVHGARNTPSAFGKSSTTMSNAAVKKALATPVAWSPAMSCQTCWRFGQKAKRAYTQGGVYECLSCLWSHNQVVYDETRYKEEKERLYYQKAYKDSIATEADRVRTLDAAAAAGSVSSGPKDNIFN